MPIDAEQWRAQTGFSCTSRMLLRPPRCKQPKPKVQAYTLSLNKKFSLAVVLVTSRTGDFYAWLIACHASRLLLSIVRMSCRRLRGVSVLLAQCLVVVPMLLIMSGDVEENPGPLKIQVTSLGPDDLNDVRRELLDVSKKWYDIGLELRLQPGDLENIECQNQDIRICLRKMLLHWLKKVDPPPTWERLACALESRTVGEPRLAEQLRTKYCKTPQAAGRPMGQRLQTATTKDEDPPSVPSRRVHRLVPTASRSPQPVTRKGVPAGGSVGQQLQTVSTKGRPHSGHAREVLPSQRLPSTTSKQSHIPQPIARKGGREHETLKEDARNSLFVNCQICFETIPDQEMVRMPGCTDKLCTECVKNHFSLIIKEKSAESSIVQYVMSQRLPTKRRVLNPTLSTFWT